MYEIGKCRLKKLLNERDLTQVEFARKMGMSKSQVNDYISGDTTSMSLVTAKNIAYMLGCSIEELYEWKFSKKK
jgi:transcriptional regulator with XRE-family HTH domain